MRIYAKQASTQAVTSDNALDLTVGTVLYYIGHNTRSHRIVIVAPPTIKAGKIKLPYDGGWLTNRDLDTGLWAKGAI